MTLGNRLRQFRNHKGYSRETAASMLGVSFSSLEKWETNRRRPTLKMAQKLAVLYGVEIDELIGDTLTFKAEKALLARLAKKYEAVLLQFESMNEHKRAELLALVAETAERFPRTG